MPVRITGAPNPGVKIDRVAARVGGAADETAILCKELVELIG